VTVSALTYQLERQQGQDVLTIPGFDLLAQPGAPRLPFKSVLLAVPPDGPVEVRVVRDEWEPLPGTYRPPLNPRPAPLEDGPRAPRPSPWWVGPPNRTQPPRPSKSW